MKRFIFACAIFSSALSFSQVINQTVTWPSANWTTTGAYTSGGVISEPSTGTTFTFDDNAAGTGSIDRIIANSPLTDLTAAYAAGEGELTISGMAIFNINNGGADVLSIEYYNADSLAWFNAFNFSSLADPLGLGLYQNCTGATAYSAVIDFANFSPNALANFRYRFIYDDMGGQGRGFCIRPPSLASASACETPSMGTASNILDTVADLSWTENGNATSWLVEILVAGSSPSRLGSAAPSNPFTASPLNPTTDYEYYVSADCGANNSTYAGPFAFTTLATIICNDPSNLTANNIIDVSATLLWTENGTANLYDIELIDSTATPTGIPTDSAITNPYQATGLTPNTAYQYFVRSECTGTTSGWSGPHYFRTKNTTTCAQPSALGANNLTTSAAELFWTENGSATTWDIEIVELGTSPTGNATFTGVSNPYTVSGLNQDTDYEFYVRADCGSEQSFYSGPFSFTTISGIQDNTQGILSLSPNPTTGEVRITFADNNQEARILLHDASGRLLKTFSTEKKEISFNIEQEKSGVYLVTVVTEKSTSTTRLIKQ